MLSSLQFSCSMPKYATFTEMLRGVRVLYVQNNYFVPQVSVFMCCVVFVMLETLAIVTQPCFLVWYHLFRLQFDEELMLAFISVFQLSWSSIY